MIDAAALVLEILWGAAVVLGLASIATAVLVAVAVELTEWVEARRRGRRPGSVRSSRPPA